MFYSFLVVNNSQANQEIKQGFDISPFWVRNYSFKNCTLRGWNLQMDRSLKNS